jgi:hypothetical protein
MNPYGGRPMMPQQRPMAPGAAPRPTMPQRRMPQMGPPGGAMLSDENSKTDIARLEGQNEALTKALDRSFTGSNMPETRYPSMPANTRVPSMGNFADSPAANKVAAQNVGLRPAAGAQQGPPPGAAPPPVQVAPPRAPPQQAPPPVAAQQMQPSPQQSNFGRSASPAFQGVGGAAPDLSELDRAYARMGQGG